MTSVTGCLSEQPHVQRGLGRVHFHGGVGPHAVDQAYREGQPHNEIREAMRGLTNEPVVVKTDKIVP